MVRARKPKDDPADAAATPLHDRVYQQLRTALITGRIVPGRAVTLRGIAAELAVSPMPVREALRRLAAERALEIRSTRRVGVPRMTPHRFAELVTARRLLEPEAAVNALAFIDRARLAEIRAADDAVEEALRTGNVELYMDANYRFHFLIYSAAPSSVLVPLIETLWLQFGPFMRSVYGRVGTATLEDQHERAMEAIRRADPVALRTAIEADIMDGMRLIGLTELDDPEEAKPRKRG
ncbi:MAG: GntR family transcriptional regulator [Hyphomicrobiaceae bacterium]|nr:GntR family transcriptional regulator [Hyphomicrobiaceae bacterium]